MGVGGKTEFAHRMAYRLYVGEPGDLFVCHHCDTPLCVNPDHLFLGTATDNIRDAMRKGRRKLTYRWPPGYVRQTRRGRQGVRA